MNSWKSTPRLLSVSNLRKTSSNSAKDSSSSSKARATCSVATMAARKATEEGLKTGTFIIVRDAASARIVRAVRTDAASTISNCGNGTFSHACLTATGVLAAAAQPAAERKGSKKKQIIGCRTKAIFTNEQAGNNPLAVMIPLQQH